MHKNVELAIEYGRQQQSPQTGFLHYHYAEPFAKHHDSIPVVKNLLFALALMRSLDGSNVQEAKNILSNLLNFQLPSGNFPVYLHEFPNSQSPWLPIELLPPCYWILKDFSKILGQKLLETFTQTITRIIDYSIDLYTTAPPGYVGITKLATATIALGSLLNEKRYISFGEKIIKELPPLLSSQPLYHPQELGEILTAYQMLSPDFDHPLCPEGIWDFLSNTWHYPTATNMGPAVKEYYGQGLPNISLYDFFMGSWTQQYPQQIVVAHPIHIKAALIRPIKHPFKQKALPHTISKDSWQSVQDPSYAYTTTNKSNDEKDAFHKAFHPIKLTWNSNKQLHVLTCHANGPTATYKNDNEHIELTFTMPETIPSPEIPQEREICFYVNQTSDLKIQVNDAPATLFHLDDSIQICTTDATVDLSFELIQGKGTFCGHIIKGNRPAELTTRNKGTYPAHDWQIILRTVAREPLCQVKATIDIQPIK